MKRVLLIFIVLVLISCDVVFDAKFREYIDNIEARTPLILKVGDNESLYIDGKFSYSFGFVAMDTSREISFTNLEAGSFELEPFAGIIENGFSIDPNPGGVVIPGESFSLNVSIDVSAIPQETEVILVNLKTKTGRPFDLHIWVSTKMQPIDFYLDGKVVNKIDFGIRQDLYLEFKNNGLVPVEIKNIVMPQGFYMEGIGIHETLQAMESKSFRLHKDYMAMLEDRISFETNFSVTKTFFLELYSGDVLDFEIQYNNQIFTNYETLYLLGNEGINLTLTNKSKFGRDLKFDNKDQNFICDLPEGFLPAEESIDFNLSIVDQGGEFILFDKITGRSFRMYVFR